MATPSGEDFTFKWSKEQTEKLIKIRCQNDILFTGAKHSATVGWRIILEKMGLGGEGPAPPGQKEDCKYPGTGEGTSGKPTAADWPWFVLMDEALGQRPSIAPPVLIASIPEDTPGPSAVGDQQGGGDEDEEEEEEEEELEESQPGPKRKRRRREDDLLSLMKEDLKMQREAEERREKESKDRTDSSLSWRKLGAAGLGCSRLDPGEASSRRLPVVVAVLPVVVAVLPPRSSAGRSGGAGVAVAVLYCGWWRRSPTLGASVAGSLLLECVC
ncbi:hypothetical protein N1851_022783 [Merluccius polli]|uniref:Uncharacterized protein n=1 Tax=Merluccius polli TaxID=89951 RepID=A0AA47MHA3_MERPO|nr:hypothetical protein N1851_022783 [Merluccius polli]